MIETVGLAGAETVVYQMAEELRSRGHTVHPVVPANMPGWLVDELLRNGFPCHTYPVGPPIDVKLPRRLARLLTRLGVDVIHSHEFVMSVYGAAAARILDKPHVITMHGNREMTRRWRRRVALRWAFRNSRATVAVSSDLQRHLESELGLSPGRVDVILNGIPPTVGQGNQVREELNVAPSDLLLLSVGNLWPRKGHAILVQAMAQLSAQGIGDGWQLAIAGQGEEQARLEALIDHSGLSDRVHLLGSRRDVPDLQAAADIFVMPSFWEGLPLAVLEAMFAGNAIVASRTSGIPEAIDDGMNGLLTPPGDVDALAVALRRVMTDSDFRIALGRAALRRAQSRFTVGAMTDDYERLYRLGS